jgi:hypothetical protein
MRTRRSPKGRRRRVSATQDDEPVVAPLVPGPRAGAKERSEVIEEANLLIRQLDKYLELIAEWAEEEESA